MAKFREATGQSFIIILGGIIVFLWIIFTPSGIIGKADAIGYALCHRIDVRSFHIGITQLPMCARCTGQYVGATIGLIILGLFHRGNSGFPTKHTIVVLILLVFIYAADGLNSYLTLPPFSKLFLIFHLSSFECIKVIYRTGLVRDRNVTLSRFYGTIYAN
jgi:uncharacterized membrane protein